MFLKNIAFGYGVFMFVFHFFNPPRVNICFLLWPCTYQAFYLIHIIFWTYDQCFFFTSLMDPRWWTSLGKFLLTTLFQITFACVAIGHKCSNIMLQFDELFSKKGIYDIIFLFKKQCHLLTNFHVKKTLPTTMSPMQIHINSSPFW
jgi:hypothetical protein